MAAWVLQLWAGIELVCMTRRWRLAVGAFILGGIASAAAIAVEHLVPQTKLASLMTLEGAEAVAGGLIHVGLALLLPIAAAVILRRAPTATSDVIPRSWLVSRVR